LPSWVKARGVSYYLVAFQGANGIGALVFGGVAQASSAATGLIVLALALVVVVPVTWRLAFPAAVGAVAMTEEPLALPEVTSVREGPISITVSYRLAPGQADAFLALGSELRRVRRRTGAVHWHLHRDLADGDRFEELFIVGSWEEHERQHERLQGPDRQVLDAIDLLLAPGEHRTARHAQSVRPPRRSAPTTRG
jgi:quinol monooxygenase YgiN